MSAEKSNGDGPGGGRDAGAGAGAGDRAGAGGAPAEGGPISEAKSKGAGAADGAVGFAGAGGARLPKSKGDDDAGAGGAGGAGAGGTGRARSGMREASTPSANTPGLVCSSLGTEADWPNLLKGSALSSGTIFVGAVSFCDAPDGGAAAAGGNAPLGELPAETADSLVTRKV